jgi:hypothetical protein
MRLESALVRPLTTPLTMARLATYCERGAQVRFLNGAFVFTASAVGGIWTSHQCSVNSVAHRLRAVRRQRRDKVRVIRRLGYRPELRNAFCGGSTWLLSFIAFRVKLRLFRSLG